MRQLNTGLLVLVLLLTTGTLANGEMIVNGDFEVPSIYPDEWGFFYQIAGWTASLGSIEIQRGPGPHTGAAFSGSQLIELDAGSNSSIFQDVYTETGKQYLLSFYYAPRNGIPFQQIQCGSHTTAIDVFWENGYLATVAEDGPSEKVNYWNQYSFPVTANDPLGISRLRFNGAGDSDSYGGLLDKVELTEIIPEPSSLVALLSLAVAGTLACIYGRVGSGLKRGPGVPTDGCARRSDTPARILRGETADNRLKVPSTRGA